MDTTESETTRRELRSSVVRVEALKQFTRLSDATPTSQTQSESNTSTSGDGGGGAGSGTDDDRHMPEPDSRRRKRVVPPSQRRGGRKKQFPQRLYTMLNESGRQKHSRIVFWQKDGKSFYVRNQDELVSKVLPGYTGQSKWTSFQRQLNLYGFRRITSGPNRGGFCHESFQRDRPDLIASMERVKRGDKDKGKSTSPDQQEALSLLQQGGAGHDQAAGLAAAGLPPVQAQAALAPVFGQSFGSLLTQALAGQQPIPGMMYSYPLGSLPAFSPAPAVMPGAFPVFQNMFVPVAAPLAPMMDPSQLFQNPSSGPSVASLGTVLQQPVVPETADQLPLEANPLATLSAAAAARQEAKKPKGTKGDSGSDHGSNDSRDSLSTSALSDRDLMSLPQNDKEWKEMFKSTSDSESSRQKSPPMVPGKKRVLSDNGESGANVLSNKEILSMMPVVSKRQGWEDFVKSSSSEGDMGRSQEPGMKKALERKTDPGAKR